MTVKARQALLYPLLLLALLALACGTSTDAPAVVATPDTEAIVADAVATIQAQSPTSNVGDNPTVTSGAVVSPELQSTLVSLYEAVNPSVVFIINGLSSGSGFVFDSDGHIVTNNHVLVGGDVFEVVFADGTRLPADIVGTDVDSDLAVIKVDGLPAGITPVTLGDSSIVHVGQFVIAIGNPFAQQSSMSFGIVSGLGRSLRSQRGLEGGGFYTLPQVIQTDAPINPGNSGGPLLDLEGRVIGVNSAISSETGFNSGVGFSIPVNAVKRVVPSIIATGVYIYPFMGVSIQSIDLTTQTQLGLPTTRGALVTSVTPEQPAEAAGLVRGDVIQAIDGTEIVDSDALISYLVFESSVGQTVNLTVLRNGETLTIPLTLGARP